MIFEIDNKQYIEFTEERFIYCMTNQLVYFAKKRIPFKCFEHPEITFFELTFFKTEKELEKVYDEIEKELKKGLTDTFAGHLIEDNGMEMTLNHDDIKFVVFHELLN